MGVFHLQTSFEVGIDGRLQKAGATKGSTCAMKTFTEDRRSKLRRTCSAELSTTVGEGIVPVNGGQAIPLSDVIWLCLVHNCLLESSDIRSCAFEAVLQNEAAKPLDV